MRPPGVVVGDPCADQMPGMGEIPEQVFVQAFIPEPPIEGLAECVLRWLAGSDVVPVESPVLNPPSTAFEVNSVPLSETIISGAPRLEMMWSSSRMTR